MFPWTKDSLSDTKPVGDLVKLAKTGSGTSDSHLRDAIAEKGCSWLGDRYFGSRIFEFEDTF